MSKGKFLFHSAFFIFDFLSRASRNPLNPIQADLTQRRRDARAQRFLCFFAPPRSFDKLRTCFVLKVFA